MYTASESIEISAPPEFVREKFLDFSQIPTYHPDGFFKEIGTDPRNQPFEPGVKMRNTLELGTFTGTLTENTPTSFKWAGGISGVFLGTHQFRFERSTKTPGGTLFVQEEKFSGAFAFLMGDNVLARTLGMATKTHKGWIRYNQDFKAWCEGSYKK